MSKVRCWTHLVITMHILCLLWHPTSQKPVEPWLLKQAERTSSCPVNHLLRKCRANMRLRGGRKCNNAISIYRSVSWFCCLSSARRKARPSFGSWEPEMRGMRGFQIWHSRGIFGILWALFLLTLEAMYQISRYVWFLPQFGGERHILNPSWRNENCFWHAVASLIRRSMSNDSSSAYFDSTCVQGGQSGCFLGVVDIKIKVALLYTEMQPLF